VDVFIVYVKMFDVNDLSEFEAFGTPLVLPKRVTDTDR
jgi:hypothetical protein